MMKQDQKPAHDTVRLFLALCPGEDVQAALAAHGSTWHWNADAARYAPADWHLTLHFIGPVARQRMDELRAGLAVPMAPFDLRFGQPELWPHGLSVLLPEGVPESLQQLHARLGQALRRLGLRADARSYRPHITLARRAARALMPAERPVLDWHVGGYALMESTGEVGHRYRVLQRYGGTP